MEKKQNGKNNLYEQISDEEMIEENKVSNPEEIKKCNSIKEEILTKNIETVSSINNISKCLLTSSKEKVSSKKFDSTKTKLKKVNLDFNDSNQKKTSNSTTKKTIFTKLSEQMYNNIFKNKDFQNIYDYESFTNESLLQKFNQVEKKSLQNNEQNRKTIKDFIIRNEKKKNEKSKIISPQVNKNKKTENNKKINLDEFLTKQNKFTEKKKQTIETMSKKIENEISKNMREKPLINSKSNQIIYEKNNTNRKNKKDIHLKLYEEYSEKKKHRTIQSDDIDESKDKKLPKKNNDIYKKLYEASKERSQSQREIERKQLNQVSKSFIVNQNSNEILAQKFLKKYETEITINFNKKADDNFNLNFSEFLLLLNKIGFTVKNYSSLKNDENNIEKEFQLSKEAWMIINEKKVFDDNENISSHKLLIFFLCVLGLYNLNILKKHFLFIDKKNRFIEPKLIKQIPNSFRLFVNNEINSFLKKEKLNRTSLSFIENIENTYTFKPKINEKIYKSKSFVNHLNESHISVVTGYDEYRKEREKSIENKKRKILENELKECTFFPNNKIFHRSKSVSISVSERLYSKNNKNEKSKNKDSKENIIVNDFTPITTSFDSKIFNNDLIQTDSDVIKRCELLSKMRKEKKLTEFLLSKGYCPNKTEVNEKILREMNESCPKDFVFDNENKNFKNTFSKFSKDKKRKKKLTKFVFEMNIDNQKKKLIIHQNDNIDLKVKQFCNENNLDFQSKSKIISAIKEKFSFIN
jgi:hypothetical protein